MSNQREIKTDMIFNQQKPRLVRREYYSQESKVLGNSSRVDDSVVAEICSMKDRYYTGRSRA